MLCLFQYFILILTMSMCGSVLGVNSITFVNRYYSSIPSDDTDKPRAITLHLLNKDGQLVSKEELAPGQLKFINASDSVTQVEAFFLPVGMKPEDGGLSGKLAVAGGKSYEILTLMDSGIESKYLDNFNQSGIQNIGIVEKQKTIAEIAAEAPAAVGDQKLEPFAKNVLLFFIDKSETNWQNPAVSNAVIDAFEQRAAPMVVSLSVLRNIFTPVSWDKLMEAVPEASRKVYDDIKKYYDSIDLVLNEAGKAWDLSLPSYQQRTVNAINNTNGSELKMAAGAISNIVSFRAKPADISKSVQDNRNFGEMLTKKYSSFKPEEWLVKKVDADFVLMVPHSYIQTMRQKFGAEKPQAQAFSETEALLGLQVDHLEIITDIVNSAKNYKSSGGLSVLAEALNKIFVPRAAYASQQKDKKEGMLGSYYVPTWALFMMGHGGIRTAIVGLPLEEFKKVLDFFETKINVKFLVYFSCYAAGTNTEIIYNDIKTNMQKTYPFVIVTAALTDDSITATAPSFPGGGTFSSNQIDFKNKKIKLYPYFEFESFAKNMMSSGTIDYVQMIAPLFVARQGVSTTPQIKLPGLEWFNVVDINKRVVSIGKALAQSGRKELDVASFFKIKPEAILLYTNFIPFTLNLNSLESMPKIVPMISDDKFYIHGISINILPIEFFSQAFTVVQAGDVRTFLIKTLVPEVNKPSKRVYEDLVVKVGIDKEKGKILDFVIDPESFEALGGDSFKKAREREEQAKKLREVQEKKLVEQRRRAAQATASVAARVPLATSSLVVGNSLPVGTA